MVIFKCFWSNDKILRECLYIPIWLYSNFVRAAWIIDGIAFTFQYGYIQIYPLFSLNISSLLSTFFVDLIFIYYYSTIFFIKVKLFFIFFLFFSAFVDPPRFLHYQGSTEIYKKNVNKKCRKILDI